MSATMANLISCVSQQFQQFDCSAKPGHNLSPTPSVIAVLLFFTVSSPQVGGGLSPFGNPGRIPGGKPAATDAESRYTARSRNPKAGGFSPIFLVVARTTCFPLSWNL